MLYIAILLILIGLFFLWKALQKPGPISSQSSPQRPNLEPEPRTHVKTIDSPRQRFAFPPATERSTPAKVELRIEGALYLDQKQSSRKLYKGKQGSEANLTLKAYNGIHRIGKAILTTQDDIVLLHSGNVSYRYAAKELDQIIFQQKGIALLPNSSRQPAAIFLSAESARFKEHIKNYSSEDQLYNP